MKKIFLTLLIVFPLYATEYFVNGAATGSNNGSSWEDGWETFADISMGSLNPGDTVFKSGGVDSLAYDGPLDLSEVLGTEANPITFIVGKYAPSSSGHSGRV